MIGDDGDKSEDVIKNGISVCHHCGDLPESLLPGGLYEKLGGQ